MCNPPSEFCRCQAIEDKSCRDRPIYVRVSCCSDDEQNCWYVIEEKPLEAESSSTTSSPSRSDEEDGNTDILEFKSKSDIVRRLSVPDSEVRYNSLAVQNSHVYLIGGDIDTEYNEDKESIGYKHLELANTQWQLGGGKLVYDQYGAAAVGHDGFIYSVGCHQYRISPKGGIIEKLPPPPPMKDAGKKVRYESRLLALTKEILFIYVHLCWRNLMVSYDLETREWDEDYPKFAGIWSSGVVLYDRYLFCFGTQDPMSPAATLRLKEVRQVVPGIYIFDIKDRRWLKKPVEGLRTDGTVLPCDYETEPDVQAAGPGYSPYLLQIGKQNDHKLALLWESERPHPKSGLPQCTLYWSKFILIPRVTSDNQEPQFYVDSLSNGFCALDEWTDLLLNCAAGM